MQTLELVIQFLAARKIPVEVIQMNTTIDGEAMLILHCLMERDKIRHTRYLLEKLEGIVYVESLESKMTNVGRMKTAS